MYIAQSAYDSMAASSGKAHIPFDEILAHPADEEQMAKYKQYTSRLLVTREENPAGHVFVNGKYAPFTLVRSMLSECLRRMLTNSNGRATCSRN